MNTSIFKENLVVLQSKFPHIAETILSVSLDNFPIEIVNTKSGAPSARISTPESGKPILLHSAYDPLREAQRWAEGIQISQPTNVVMFGSGLGYHLLTLLAQCEENIRYFFLVEFDPRVFYVAMNAVDLRRFLSREGTDVILAEEPDNIPLAIGERRTDIILHNCKILEHEPSIRCYPNYYRSARESIVDAITYDEINLRTTFENQGRNQFNILMNLATICNGQALKEWEGRFAGYPAVISAAGPSLDKNVDGLHELKDRALLIAVDTAQKTFRKHGIEPHIIVTADPTPLNFSHFEQIDHLGNAFLAFHPEVNRQIPQKYVHHPYLLPLFDQDSALLNQLFPPETYGIIDRAMNVGHIAFNLAQYVGCAPLVLVGFDFAFPPEGGTTHAKDASLSRQMTRIQADGTVTISGKEGKASEESGKMMLVPGYYGDQVPTTAPFSQYIKALERMIADCLFEVYDSTEGGAAFEGSVRVPLQEALARVLRQTGVSDVLDRMRERQEKSDVERVVPYLQEGLAVLKKGREYCQKMARELENWHRILSIGSINRTEAEKKWNTFEKLWLEMVSNPLFDAFLGTSVQYLYFRRQRHERIKDQSGEAFLECMYNKYHFIISEMASLLENFIQCVELSIQLVQSVDQNEKENR